MKSVSDLIERDLGTRNWVVARRTANILARYGEDVVTLSSKQLAVLEKRFEIETAENHPAYGYLKSLLGNHCDAVNIIRGLREEGFRIEQVFGEKA